jgi:hypothetical protein
MTAAAPAGFWRRYAAYSLDFALLATLATVLGWSRLLAACQTITNATRSLTQALRQQLEAALSQGGVAENGLIAQLLRDRVVQSAAENVQSGIMVLLWSWLLVYAVLAALYHVGFERSRWQASPGKRALGLSVVSADADAPATLWQTVVRHAAGALSWLTLNLGHALAAVPPEKRALHDYLAGTRVVMADAGARLPAWARAWLWLQVLALAAAPAWLVMREVAALRASL